MNSDVDFKVYHQILSDLFKPIDSQLDTNTRKHLYESKLTYLNYLREKVFVDLNRNTEHSPFSQNDIQNIIEAISLTKAYLKDLYLSSLYRSLDQRTPELQDTSAKHESIPASH